MIILDENNNLISLSVCESLKFLFSSSYDFNVFYKSANKNFWSNYKSLKSDFYNNPDWRNWRDRWE